MDLLDRIVALSHHYGTDTYVKGGGGNTSVKNADTLWVKPSGTTLGGLTRESFVPINRQRLAELDPAALPSGVKEREEAVKNLLMSAVAPGSTGRPSVETMLHNAFAARFVVHTHPAAVNGLTCAVNGRSECHRLFPESVWIEYTDPGYVLFARVDAEIVRYREHKGKEPAVIFLENHGVFVAGDDEAAIAAEYGNILGTLASEYNFAEIGTKLTVNAVELDETGRTLARLLGAEICACGDFPVAAGPLTPDHIVYAKSFPLLGEVSERSVAEFKQKHGYLPVIVRSGGKVYASGASASRAALALELAQDGALVERLTGAFGGVRYMSDAARSFIENWEAESYRSAQMK